MFISLYQFLLHLLPPPCQPNMEFSFSIPLPPHTSLSNPWSLVYVGQVFLGKGPSLEYGNISGFIQLKKTGSPSFSAIKCQQFLS